MKDSFDFFWIGLLVGSLMVGFVTHMATKNYYRGQTIEHNCGQYNPQTGDFEWKGGGE